MATAAKALLERLLAETQAPDPTRLAPLFLMLKQQVRDLHGRASEVRDRQLYSREEEAMYKELVTLQWQRAQLTQEIAQTLVSSLCRALSPRANHNFSTLARRLHKPT